MPFEHVDVYLVLDYQVVPFEEDWYQVFDCAPERFPKASPQDAKVDLKPFITSAIPIYGFSDTINLFCVLFFYFN